MHGRPFSAEGHGRRDHEAYPHGAPHERAPVEQAALPVAVEVPLELGDAAPARHGRDAKYVRRGSADAERRAPGVERPRGEKRGGRAAVGTRGLSSARQQCARGVELQSGQLRGGGGHRPQRDAG